MVVLWIFVALGYLLLYAFAVMQTQEWCVIINRIANWAFCHDVIGRLGDKWAALPWCNCCLVIKQFVSCSAADWYCAVEAWIPNHDLWCTTILRLALLKKWEVWWLGILGPRGAWTKNRSMYRVNPYMGGSIHDIQHITLRRGYN